MAVTPFITDAQAQQKVQESHNALQQQITGIASGYKGAIVIADTPTEDGIYSPTEAGTYTNAGGLVYDLLGADKGWDVKFIKTGASWVKDKVDLNLAIAADGENLSGSTKVFKGNQIFNQVKSEIASTLLPNDAVTDEILSTNLFDVENDIVANSYLSTGGLIFNSSNWGRSRLFTCAEGEKIHLQGSFGRERFVFYSDEAGTVVVGNDADNHGMKTAPAGAIRYAFNIYQPTNLTYSNIMLNKGELALPYAPFGSTYKIKQSSLPVDENAKSSLQLNGVGNDVIIYGKKSTRVVEALSVNSLTDSRVFNFKTDSVNGEIFRENTNDDVAPARLDDQTLLANHSYYGYLVNSVSHGKTTVDIGSIFTYNSIEFVLIGIISVDSLIVMAEITGSNLINAVTLTYVSGGVSTTNIAVTTQSNQQIYPCFQNYNLDIIVDGVNIDSVDGKYYYSKNVSFQESFSLLTRESIYSWYKNSYDGSLNIVGDDLLFVSNNYIFDIDGNCTIVGDYTFNTVMAVNHIMALQGIKSNHLPKYYVPKTLEFSHEGIDLNFSLIENNDVLSTGSAVSVNFTSEKLDASPIPSDRWLQLDTDKGFVMGFLPIGSAGVNRAANTTYRTAEIRGNTDKMYPRLIDRSGFSSVAGESYSYIAYRNIFLPESGATANYPVRTNGDDFYYVDYHNTTAVKQIKMPLDYLGRTIEVIESRNITCNNLIVTSSLTINVDCTDDYGYLVIKVKK